MRRSYNLRCAYISPELAHNTLLLSVSGLLCGALSAGGAVVTALAFVFACAIGLMAVGYSGSTFPMLLNFAVGAVVFAAIPENRIRNLFKYIGGNSRAVYIVGQTASSRLKFTSGTLKDVRRRLLSISDTLEKKKAVAPLSQRSDALSYTYIYSQAQNHAFPLYSLKKR